MSATPSPSPWLAYSAHVGGMDCSGPRAPAELTIAPEATPVTGSMWLPTAGAEPGLDGGHCEERAAVEAAGGGLDGVDDGLGSPVGDAVGGEVRNGRGRPGRHRSTNQDSPGLLLKRHLIYP